MCVALCASVCPSIPSRFVIQNRKVTRHYFWYLHKCWSKVEVARPHVVHARPGYSRTRTADYSQKVKKNSLAFASHHEPITFHRNPSITLGFIRFTDRIHTQWHKFLVYPPPLPSQEKTACETDHLRLPPAARSPAKFCVVLLRFDMRMFSPL